MIEEIKRRLDETSATFDDLIDVAVKAYKDGIADEIILNADISISAQAETYGVLKTDTNSFEVKETIKKIKSLYTETFVIESQSDLSMIKLNDKKTKVKLTNGELVNDEFWDNLKNMTGKTQFLLLKGATVTQKRGR